MATHAHTTPDRRPATPPGTGGRRSLAAGIAALALAVPTLAGTRAAAKPDAERLATPADFAALEYEVFPNMTEGLGTRQEWLANIKGRYANLWFAAATLGKTPDEVAHMVATLPDETGSLMECLSDLKDRLEAELEVVSVAHLRLMAGACRAGLV